MIDSKALDGIGLLCSASLSFVLRRKSNLSYLLGIYILWAEITKAIRQWDFPPLPCLFRFSYLLVIC